MLFNRHLIIMSLSILLIGVIFWWQNPTVAITAMSQSDYAWNSYTAVKSYWKRMDNRQFDLAKSLVTEEAIEDHNIIQNKLNESQLLSIQRIEIKYAQETDTYLCDVTLGSVIDDREEGTYLVNVHPSDNGWSITSIKAMM
ncbi:MAG: hypothetical protein APF84_17605 [Gracilibacter sp. BRH_c7a]|nr:MAG: hypothetical protein APF84_17605 [Gracilibacter sp. BRH_c7a]